jgi:hypothetical protein
MPDNRVVIEYQQPVSRAPGVRRRFVGETYVVSDAATAEAVHPGAKVTKYADGRKFVRAQDESLAAVREAEAKAAEKEAAKAAKKSIDTTTSTATAANPSDSTTVTVQSKG